MGCKGAVGSGARLASVLCSFVHLFPVKESVGSRSAESLPGNHKARGVESIKHHMVHTKDAQHAGKAICVQGDAHAQLRNARLATSRLLNVYAATRWQPEQVRDGASADRPSSVAAAPSSMHQRRANRQTDSSRTAPPPTTARYPDVAQLLLWLSRRLTATIPSLMADSMRVSTSRTRGS